MSDLTASPGEILKSALEVGPQRLAGQDSADLVRLGDDVLFRMSQGDEIRAWDDLEHRFRWMPEGPAIEAAQELARNDLDALLRLFSKAKPLAVQMFVPFIQWSEDLGERWLRSACSQSIAALGVLLWLDSLGLRQTAPEDDGRFGRVLLHLSEGLAGRRRDEEVALWWQTLAMAYSVAPSAGPLGMVRAESLFESAAAALGRLGGDDALPPLESLRLWRGGNPELAAVLPRVADRAHPAQRRRLLEAFFVDVERRLDGETHEIPDITKMWGLFYANACGHAIVLQASFGDEPSWWSTRLDHYLSKLSGWKADPSPTATERAAWVTCAAAIAALKLAKDSNQQSRDIVEALFARVEDRLSDWLWEADARVAPARFVLQELAVRVACLDAATASRRIMSVIAVAVDSASLGVLRREVASVLSQDELAEIEQLIARRIEFEGAIEGGSVL